MDTDVVQAVVSQSREELVRQGVLEEGHFERHDGKHTKWYFNTEPIVYYGTIWRVVQDLVAVVPSGILDEVEIVAGPQSVGDILAASMTNIISTRSSKTRLVYCVPIERQFQIVGPDLGKTVYRIRSFYREQLASKKVLFVDNVFASGRTSNKCAALLEDVCGAFVIGSTYIADLGVIGDARRSAIWREPAKDVYNRFDCPMCKSQDPEVRKIMKR